LAAGAHGAARDLFEGIDLAELLAAHGPGPAAVPRGPPVGPGAGQDQETTAGVTLEQALHGASLTLHLRAGAGTETTLEVTVPPGVRDGQKLRLRGKGGKGQRGGPDGDIYLHLQLLPHAVFRVEQLDLLFDLLLAPWEAVLGAEVEVPTLDGPVLLTVPPATQSGRKLRLRGRGLLGGHGARGHLVAVVRIHVPDVPSERERALFQDLARESTFNPRANGGKEPHAATTH
jgi:curved DNA-binding protein